MIARAQGDGLKLAERIVNELKDKGPDATLDLLVRTALKKAAK